MLSGKHRTMINIINWSSPLLSCCERMKLISQQHHHPTSKFINKYRCDGADGTVSFKSVQNKNLFQQQGWLFHSETKVHPTVAYNKQKQNSRMHLNTVFFMESESQYNLKNFELVNLKNAIKTWKILGVWHQKILL